MTWFSSFICSRTQTNDICLRVFRDFSSTDGKKSFGEMASDDGNSAVTALNQQLSQEFADITETDPVIAESYLEKTSWKLEDAVNMFYDSDRPAGAADDNGVSQGAETSHNPAEEVEPSHETHQISEGDGSQEYASVNRKQADHTAQASSSKTSEPSLLSSRVRLITWNIDGLDEKCIGQRTRAVCEILKRYAPDIIFLQEVIPETCKIICSQLSNYKPFPASDEAYFTLILLRKSTVTCLSDKIESFPDSAMLRALQIVDCKCAGIDLRLMSSHLESTGENRAATERQKQFSRAVYLMKTAPPEQTVLFGGDTNLRDKEVKKFGLPTYIHDVWEMIGSPSESRYTWDLTNNDNLDWPFPNRPRLRFDRLYLRHPKTMSEVLAPNTFDLLGRERLSCNKFPSDHWGIVCDFQVKTSPPQVAEGSPSKKFKSLHSLGQ